MRYEVSKIIRQTQVMELVYGNNAVPGEILGRHRVGEGQVIAAYHPDAVSMAIEDASGRVIEMDSVERHPVFAVYLPEKEPFPYKLIMRFPDGNTYVTEDPYRFEAWITGEEEALFCKGAWTSSYRKMGAHPLVREGVAGVCFAVWAPSARRVSVVGDFNYWNGLAHPMNRIGDSGIFTLFVPGVRVGQYYKYEIKTWDGSILLKADPCGMSNQSRNGSASRVVSMDDYTWQDADWMKTRRQRFGRKRYVNIADCSRLVLSEKILDRDFSRYTHVLFSGCDARYTHRSWIKSGVYSLPFEEREPAEMKAFVDACHRKDLGVILYCDFGYFHNLSHGLEQFDGTALYGFSDERKFFNDAIKMFRFSFSRPEVNAYLHSAIMFWLQEYHIDGLIFENQEETVFPLWDFEKFHEDPGLYRKCSLHFFEEAYRRIKDYDPGILVIGEQHYANKRSESMPLKNRLYDYYVEHEAEECLETYWTAAPEGRAAAYYKLTQRLQAVGSEESLVILNRNRYKEVHHENAARYKMSCGYLAGIPGMKMWRIRDSYDPNIQEYIDSLLKIVHDTKTLHHVEYGLSSFEWINGMNPRDETLCFLRKSSEEEDLLFLCNFGAGEFRGFRVGVPAEGVYTLLSDSSNHTGSRSLAYRVRAEEIPRDLRRYSIAVQLMPYTTLIFKVPEIRA